MIKNLNKKNKKKGFTLIELIIVIAIIAILAAVAIPRFGEVRRNANIKADIATAKNIQSAVVALLGENKLDYNDDYELDGEDEDAQVILDYLQSTPKVTLVKDSYFIVDVDDKGNITVSIGDDQVYPEPSEDESDWYPSED